MDVDCTGTILHTDYAAETQTVDGFIAFVRETFEFLRKEKDLSPANPRIAEAVSRLSSRLRLPYSPREVHAVLNDEYIRLNRRELQEKLSEAECLGELGAARVLSGLGGPALDIVAGLPNWNVYLDMVSHEMSALRRHVRRDRYPDSSPIVFVGSGPVPLSAIILHLYGDAEAVCLEMDSAARDSSVSLLRHLGLDSKVTVVKANGSDFDYGPYGRIFVASLVRNKFEVLERISRTSRDPLVAVRTAEGVRQLMYESVDETELDKRGWRIVGRTCPEDRLFLNSTLFLERGSTPAGPD